MQNNLFAKYIFFVENLGRYYSMDICGRSAHLLEDPEIFATEKKTDVSWEKIFSFFFLQKINFLTGIKSRQ